MPSETSTLIPITQPSKPSFATFLSSFWPLSLISFGGPQAHVALMIDRYVDASPPHPQIPESTFLELYALSQALPGPGSTQLATSLGAIFGGLLGAFITFFIWHLPGFLVMTIAGVWFHKNLGDNNGVQVISNVADHAVGFIAAAFAFVLLAAYKIVSAACGMDGVKMAICLISMFVAVTIPPETSSWVFIVLLAMGGLVYYLHTTTSGTEQEGRAELSNWESSISTSSGVMMLVVAVLITVVLAAWPTTGLGIKVLKIFWRIGFTVFGGGIVVVPMLLNEFVESGLLPTSVFLAGFGLFGCVPGPMFNLAPFLGAAVLSWPGAFYGSIGLFGPGLLLMLGFLPFWERVRKNTTAQTILQGTNSAASGLILAGVWMLLKKAMVGPTAFGLTCLGGALKVVYGFPPAKLIVVCGVLGFILVWLDIGKPFHLEG